MEAILERYREPLPRVQELEPVHRFNNFVKACLISRYLRPCGQVLDMPCGRGGDLKKFRENRAGSYLGLDVVPERVAEARTRHKTTRCMFGATFEIRDFTQDLRLQSRYDLVSCQFALHYAWDTEERARTVLQNAADCMAEGAYFILTFPDHHSIVDRLCSAVASPDDHNYVRWNGSAHVYRIGGPHHSLVFESPLPFLPFAQELHSSPFGRAYVYSQQGSVPGIPEFMIEPAKLRAMCEEQGLRAVFSENFTAFQNRRPFGDDWDSQALRSRMQADVTLDAEQRKIVGLYRALVLAKASQKRRRISPPSTHSKEAMGPASRPALGPAESRAS